jgi:hypothetical protein
MHQEINLFPPCGGISQYYSPRVIIYQRDLEYEKHCSFPFGSYVQAHTESDPKNTIHPSALDCIYLRFTNRSNNETSHNNHNSNYTTSY